MKKRLKIKLTPRQIKKLSSLFEEAHEAAEKGEKGMILFQANEGGDLLGLFFPMEWSEQLGEIAQDYREHLEEEEERKESPGRKRNRG